MDGGDMATTCPHAAMPSTSAAAEARFSHQNVAFQPLYQTGAGDFISCRGLDRLVVAEPFTFEKSAGLQWIHHIWRNTSAPPAACSHRSSWSRPTPCEP